MDKTQAAYALSNVRHPGSVEDETELCGTFHEDEWHLIEAPQGTYTVRKGDCITGSRYGQRSAARSQAIDTVREIAARTR